MSNVLDGVSPPPTSLSYVWRVIAAAAATIAVLLALIGSDRVLADIADPVFGAVGSGSAAADDVRTWARAALLIAAGVLVLTRGVWADVVMLVSLGLVVAAVVGQGKTTNDAVGERAAKTLVAPKLKDGATRFTVPASKVQAPGTALDLPKAPSAPGTDVRRGLPVDVVMVVPVRDTEGTLSHEARTYAGVRLATSVTTDGPGEPVAVDVQERRTSFAADLTAAKAIYLLPG